VFTDAKVPARERDEWPLVTADETVVWIPGITPREDPTNRSLRFARNRIRHRVLPELAKLNPEISSAIARLADAAAAVADRSAEHAAAMLDVAADRGASPAAANERGLGGDTLAPGRDKSAPVRDTLALDRLPDSGDARANALVLWWERASGQKLGSRHRAALEKLAASTHGSRALDLPGGRAIREYATLRMTPGDVGMARADKKLLRDGAVALERGNIADWHGWRFALDADIEGMAHVARLDSERVIVRGRRPGDRMSGPRGAKVQDVFTDAKVPARERDEWPLVTADETVVWIPGITPSPQTGRSTLRARRVGKSPTE
jgi:tRNA(Ile)-lysidine synthase